MDVIILLLIVLIVCVIICAVIFCICMHHNSESFTTNPINVKFKLGIPDTKHELNSYLNFVVKGQGVYFNFDPNKGIMYENKIIIPIDYIEDINKTEIKLKKMLYGYGANIFKCTGKLKNNITYNIPMNEINNNLTKLYLNESDFKPFTCISKKAQSILINKLIIIYDKQEQPKQESIKIVQNTKTQPEPQEPKERKIAILKTDAIKGLKELHIIGYE